MSNKCQISFTNSSSLQVIWNPAQVLFHKTAEPHHQQKSQCPGSQRPPGCPYDRKKSPQRTGDYVDHRAGLQ